MSKLYLLDVGYVEPTVIYELVPKEIARLDMATLPEIDARMTELGAKFVVVDSAHPQVVNHLLLLTGEKEGSGIFARRAPKYHLIKGRLPRIKK